MPDQSVGVDDDVDGDNPQHHCPARVAAGDAGGVPAGAGGVDAVRLAAAAAYVLRGNDSGTVTLAAPRLYPHLWSWDSAVIAIGLATVSLPRAITELRSILRGQWRTGMLPHIIFAASEDGSYFPGADVWTSGIADAAPRDVATSGICQPPIHALAVRRVLDEGRRRGGAERRAAETFVADTFDQWLAWHRWLVTARDPERRGLMEIHHSWESGMDNSPRWDAAYARITPGLDLLPRPRPDLRHVADPSQRPSDDDYRRYLWLVHQLKEIRYDDRAALSTVDFRVGDVFSSALAALASEVLAGIGDELHRDAEAAELRGYAERFRAGVLDSVSAETGLARDRDMRRGSWLDARTVGGFAPLLCGGDRAVTDRLARLLAGDQWCGHPGLRYALPPTTSPLSPQFRPGTYWRGPQWPVINWLFSRALSRLGYTDLAAGIRDEGLRQLSDLAFGEYYQPFTGEALGSRDQSWTAAVTLDWLLPPRAAGRGGGPGRGANH